MSRYQIGSLRQEQRKAGPTWVLRFYAQKGTKRVERTVAVGLVSDFPSEFAARQEVARQHLLESINQPEFQGPFTFGDLAQHYEENELGDQFDAVDPKSHSTIAGYKRNLRLYILPKWGLKTLKRERNLQNPTMDKQRRLMNLVYKSAQRYGLLPRTEECNPIRYVRCKTTSGYEAQTISPAQGWAIWSRLPEPESTLTLLAAITGLRISECLGLKWGDVDFASQVIQVRRTWTGGIEGLPKSKASQAAVPLHPVLASHMSSWKQATPYGKETDWVFPSFKLKGKKPRVANMLVEDHLRPAAISAGVIKDSDDIRFGFHPLRHSLASYLVQQGKDPKTVHTLLRHADVATTLGIYAHSRSADRMAAQGDMLTAFFAPSGTVQ